MEKTNLTANQLKAIRCMVESKSVEEASKKARVSRGTIYNWLKDPCFQARLAQERKKLFEEGLNLILVATKEAAQTLTRLLGSQNQTTQRLAAKEIINFSLQTVAIQDFEERIKRLERIVQSESPNFKE